MTEIFTERGIEWVADKTIDNETGVIDTMMIGTGTTDPSLGDTSLENEVHRASTSSPRMSVVETSQVGQLELTIEITADNEVSAGTDITEYGVETSDGTFIYREVRDPITIEIGQNVEFVIQLQVTQ